VLSDEDGLTYGGRPRRLEPRVRAVLDYLISAAPRTVSRDELKATVWPDIFVTRASIDQAVARLRKAFHDSPRRPRFIETVSKIGYRFIAEITFLPAVHPKRPPDEIQSPRTIRGPEPLAINLVDRSRFVRDVTIPDGSVVRVKERFVKKWEIENVGTVPWRNRFLVRQGPSAAAGRLVSAERTPIPDTMPGQRCVIAVDLTAPATPGSCYAEWKMTDAAGNLSLPRQSPVYVSVDVKE